MTEGPLSTLMTSTSCLKSWGRLIPTLPKQQDDNQMAYGIQEPKDLAKLIDDMSYHGLLEVAEELVAMNKPEGTDAPLRDIATRHGMADTLSDWARAVVEEIEERERARAAKKLQATSYKGDGEDVGC
jgi:hypothetical protein